MASSPRSNAKRSPRSSRSRSPRGNEAEVEARGRAAFAAEDGVELLEMQLALQDERRVAPSQSPTLATWDTESIPTTDLSEVSYIQQTNLQCSKRWHISLSVVKIVF